MTTLTITLPRLHPGQRRVLEHRERFACLALGRRWGKTTLAVDLAVRTALAGRPVGWFSPTYQLLAEAWREVKRRLLPVVRHVSEQEHRLELWGGGVVECWSLDGPNPARGRKYARVILDEASIVRDLLPRWHEAIRPTLTDLEGDALILGTPQGHNGFWRLYMRGVAGEPGWSAHTGPTADNPHISGDEIEAARRDMPERAFRQEYLAEFIEDGSGVFRRVLEAATLQPEERVEGHYYVAGVDWAREFDYTVVSVIDATARRQVALDRFSQVEFALQYARVAALHERYRLTAILAEENAMGKPVVEALQRAPYALPVRPWTATNATKAAVVDSLALALERGDLGLLDDEAQTGELLAYAAERLPSGLVRYAAPVGMHDDTVTALCLAWEAASTTRPRAEPVPYHVTAGTPSHTPPTPAERLKQIRGRGVDPFARKEGA